MSSELLVSQLKKAGWSGFSPDEFLGVAFEAVSKAKIARSNWFALLKTVPVLDVAGFDTWSNSYAHFAKRSPAGMFRSGKYFILILVADTVGADAWERLSEGPTPGFLEIPEEITRGGGYALLVIKDRRQVLMPKKIVLWDILRATQFVERTHQAVVDFVSALSPQGGRPDDKPILGLGRVHTERYG